MKKKAQDRMSELFAATFSDESSAPESTEATSDTKAPRHRAVKKSGRRDIVISKNAGGTEQQGSVAPARRGRGRPPSPVPTEDRLQSTIRYTPEIAERLMTEVMRRRLDRRADASMQAIIIDALDQYLPQLGKQRLVS